MTVPYEIVESPFTPVVSTYIGDPSQVLADQEAPKAVDGPPTLQEVKGSRNTALYNAHSYHTKVPPETILPFLEHFTRPGDVVLDPFGGSGMTGLAAVLAGRRAIVNDLSPAAAHLAFNHTRPIAPDQLRAGFEVLAATLRPRFEKLYGTTHEDGGPGYIHYTLWSKFYACPYCKTEFSLFSTIDRDEGRVGKTLPCPTCGEAVKRHNLRPVDDRPVLISYEATDGVRTVRHERPPTNEDLAQIAKFRREHVVGWYPSVPVSPSREMYIRSALHLQGIRTTADFYTPRNLQALAWLWEEIQRIDDVRLRQALAFAFTNTAWHGTRMRRFNARGGQRPLTGTLFIPQVSSEANVLEVMRNKIRQLEAFYTALGEPEGPLPVVRVGSATKIFDIPAESVDYVFTDPPFGSNIFYADCNLIWEAWLGSVTKPEEEAVVNRSRGVAHGGKTLEDYQNLMTASLREMYRVLKPGGWATLVFHNTDPDVWRALQAAAAAAGFDIATATTMNRAQQSHKGYKGRAGEERVAHYDVMLSLRRLADVKVAKQPRRGPTRKRLRELVASFMEALPQQECTVQRVHSGMLRELAKEGQDLGAITFDLIRELVEELKAASQRKAKQTARRGSKQAEPRPQQLELYAP